MRSCQLFQERDLQDPIRHKPQEHLPLFPDKTCFRSCIETNKRLVNREKLAILRASFMGLDAQNS